jgi:hypothetical protein
MGGRRSKRRAAALLPVAATSLGLVFGVRGAAAETTSHFTQSEFTFTQGPVDHEATCKIAYGWSYNKDEATIIADTFIFGPAAGTPSQDCSGNAFVSISYVDDQGRRHTATAQDDAAGETSHVHVSLNQISGTQITTSHRVAFESRRDCTACPSPVSPTYQLSPK